MLYQCPCIFFNARMRWSSYRMHPILTENRFPMLKQNCGLCKSIEEIGEWKWVLLLFNTSFWEYQVLQATLTGSLRLLIEYLVDVTGTTTSTSPLSNIFQFVYQYENIQTTYYSSWFKEKIIIFQHIYTRLLTILYLWYL